MIRRAWTDPAWRYPLAFFAVVAAVLLSIWAYRAHQERQRDAEAVTRGAAAMCRMIPDLDDRLFCLAGLR